ncbi:type 1 fimbrial protein [Salmonella enterica]|uniref:Fimbrial protein n=2 Tax=Salmonella enterica TaxID=28901 RepID=A0A5Z7T0A0_SALER|nr:hypothetical protein [Salmonella enterica]EBP4002248.1 fimbrial protein [Salmonella enterica subsp. enterica]EBW4116938.1 hypothetical protein [Salmonella enterica subsp. enterica serovar Oranienburg]ECD9467821.1 fimbrial protein [Salmonella enterica subsp. diarizonae]ECF3464462.1 hypothetical protein [Salmonella enterica subsp. enterica serovar Virchow]EDE6687423.1 fimbrial protein [Salmonella enterica subsp. enterica serovar Apeyeme]EDR5777960.1 fimbrial protein [Salmonella enterica subs
MKRNALSVLLMIISPVVWADNHDVTVNLGNLTLQASQPVNSVFAEKEVNIPALCTADCDDVTVTWTPLAKYLSSPEKGVYQFESGIKGIAIQIRTKNMEMQPSVGQPVSFTAGLVRTSLVVGGGMTTLPPLLQWTLKKDGQPVPGKQGNVIVGGSLTTGSCVLMQKNLVFRLNPVDTSKIKNTTPGEPVTGSGNRQSINVDCTPGIAYPIDISFKAKMTKGNKNIIQATRGSGLDAGVGFIIKGGDDEKDTISWDGIPINVSVPADSGQLRYPLTAYLTPLAGGAIEAGDFTGSASFDINYH